MTNAEYGNWARFYTANRRATPFARPQWLWPSGGFGGCGEAGSWIMDLGCGYAPLRLMVRNTTRTVRIMGQDYEDIVTEPGKEVQAVSAMLRGISDRRKEWDICDFRTLLPDSVLMSVFTNEAFELDPHRGLTSQLSGFVCAILPHNLYHQVAIPPTWAAYEEHLGKKLAYQMRAAEGRRGRQFGTSQLRIATVNTLEEDIDALFSLHTERWTAKGFSGHFSTPEARQSFKDRAAGFLGIGQLRLYTLWLDGKAAGALFALADDRRIYYHSSGFDLSHGKHHPTKVLIAQAIKDGLDHGPKEFDFMKGQEEYKQDWANASRLTYRIIIAKKTLAGLAALSVLKAQSRYRDRKSKREN